MKHGCFVILWPLNQRPKKGITPLHRTGISSRDACSCQKVEPWPTLIVQLRGSAKCLLEFPCPVEKHNRHTNKKISWFGKELWPGCVFWCSLATGQATPADQCRSPPLLSLFTLVTWRFKWLSSPLHRGLYLRLGVWGILSSWILPCWSSSDLEPTVAFSLYCVPLPR